jgi:hypothetical protein
MKRTYWDVGLRSVAVLLAAGLIRCQDSSTPIVPIHTRQAPWQVPSSAKIRDIAFDQKRNVVYASQPDSARVLVLSLASKSYDTPLSFLGQPRGLDLSPSGDSLFVAERNTSHVTVLNLVSSVRTTFTVNTFLFNDRGPDAVKVMKNNTALATVTFDGGGFGGNLVKVNLVTDTFVNLAPLGEYAPIARSADRSSALVVDDTWCCSLVETFVYSTAVDAITAHQGSVSAPHFFSSADSAANRLLIGGTLFTNSLSPVGSIAPAGATGPSVLAPDGRSAYFATATGLTRIAIPDRTVLETTTLGDAPYLLVISPDGLILIAVTPGFLHVLDES